MLYSGFLKRNHNIFTNHTTICYNTTYTISKKDGKFHVRICWFYRYNG